ATKEGWRRFRWKVAWSSLSAVTSLRLIHHASRALSRSLSCTFPCSRSQVHLTSLAVNGLPSCHLTPGCNLKVSSVPSAFHDQLSARSGTMSSRLFSFWLGTTTTRLLKTSIIGATTEIVPPS